MLNCMGGEGRVRRTLRASHADVERIPASSRPENGPPQPKGPAAPTPHSTPQESPAPPCHPLPSPRASQWLQSQPGRGDSTTTEGGSTCDGGAMAAATPENPGAGAAALYPKAQGSDRSQPVKCKKPEHSPPNRTTTDSSAPHLRRGAPANPSTSNHTKALFESGSGPSTLGPFFWQLQSILSLFHPLSNSDRLLKVSRA